MPSAAAHRSRARRSSRVTTPFPGKTTTMRRFLLPLAALLLLPACTSDQTQAAAPAAQDPQFITPEGPWPYPFSPAVRVGNMLYLAGQIGSRTENGQMVLVPGGIEAETRQTMENIREVLERSGSSLGHVVRCLVMLDDMSEWPRMNDVYATFFPGPKPARSALGADGLALGARVEIECIAVISDKGK